MEDSVRSQPLALGWYPLNLKEWKLGRIEIEGAFLELGGKIQFFRFNQDVMEIPHEQL